ncbi:MAG: tRNA (adenosine(37)-N6)-dimethylallyltransferase MiaA [Candidatus Izimaplasma sp.]|nr:tRNA (adenosine(37)-N6)-dimethylallyltransferase MiaA [Candidatus Izimaplasma bacterium]
MIIVIVGPTGIGKTKLSIALAQRYNTEIISGDSVQVYKGLDIGSAKIKEDEKKGIKHHLIDILEPHEDYNVAIFQKEVRKKISELERQGKTPIIVGGTGLYIKSVLYDYNFENTRRDDTLKEMYQDLSNEELHRILVEKDYDSSLLIHPNNRKRVLQAISRSTGSKISKNKNKDVPLYDFKVIGLTMERGKLYQSIDIRVDKMIEQGLLKEVRGLMEQGVTSNSVKSIGYKELYSYLLGECEFDIAVDKIKQHSRNLAKKQYTFFNNQFNVNWIQVDFHHFEETIEEAIKIIEKG